MKPFIAFVLTCFFGSVVPSWGDIVWSENFEGDDIILGTITQTNEDIGNVQPANTLTSEVVAPPAGFTGAGEKVLLLSTGTNNFSAIRPSAALTPINLPPVAAGLRWRLEFDIFIPEELPESVGAIASFRWKDGGLNNTNGSGDGSMEQFEAGLHHIVYEGEFPIVGNNDPFLPTNVRPFIAFSQGVAMHEFVFFDNLVFDVEVSADDPNLLAEGVNFGTLVQSEGSYIRPVTIMNSGAAAPLNITAAEITGFDSSFFSLEDPGFPLTIDAGESGVIMITFDPEDELGSFLSTLQLTSDDQSDPVILIDLLGTIQEPFIGTELIVNGDFEAGDLTGWNDLGNLVFQQAPPARSGIGSALYTTEANQEFGSATLSTVPPFGFMGDIRALTITEEMRGAAYEYSAWYYRPSVGGIGNTDEVTAIFRWNGSPNRPDQRGALFASSIPFNTWVRAVGTGTVPAVGGDDLETTNMIPIFSFRDRGADNPGGEMMFIDEVSFKVDAPAPTLPIPLAPLDDVSVDPDTGVVSISWRGLPDFTYSFERITDLSGSWETIAEELTAVEGEVMIFEDQEAAMLGEPRLFYRLRRTPVPVVDDP